MKKKTLLLLLFIVVSIMLVSTVVFATVNNNEYQQKILTGEKVSSVEETYKEENLNLTRTVDNSNDILNLANEHLEDINVETVAFTNENSSVKRFSNGLDSRQETVISNDSAVLKINSETGELLSYINNKNEFAINTFNDTEIREKAIKIFNSLNNIDKNNYEIIYVEKFDDEIWRAGFAKKYDGIINQSENIKFSFCPETEELVTLSINKIAFDNNEVIISTDDARTIAQTYLNKSVADNMSIDIEIVRPNYFYEETSENNSIYKNINTTRKAYVCTFNNEAESKVYIDCTTGEIIGDMILGGEY